MSEKRFRRHMMGKNGQYSLLDALQNCSDEDVPIDQGVSVFGEDQSLPKIIREAKKDHQAEAQQPPRNHRRADPIPTQPAQSGFNEPQSGPRFAPTDWDNSGQVFDQAGPHWQEPKANVHDHGLKHSPAPSFERIQPPGEDTGRIEPTIAGFSEPGARLVPDPQQDRITREAAKRTAAAKKKAPKRAKIFARRPKKTRADRPRRTPLFETWFPIKDRSWPFHVSVVSGYWLTVLGLWAALCLGSLVTVYTMVTEDPLKAGLDKQPAKLTILATGKKVIAEKGLRRNHVPISELPDHLLQAVLATEDRRFYYHFGFDPIGITRAAIANRKAGRIVQGGSTITQQLVKVLFLKPDRTYWRKIEEMLLSLSLEYRLEKKQILELYLNRIYFGAGNYGVEAAAQHYFGKSASEVGVYEGAILAGLIKSPSYYAPTRNFERALERGKLVLGNMLVTGALSQQSYQAILAKKPKLRAYLPGQSYGYVIDLVVQRVSEFGLDLKEDMVVQTTIDYDLQGATQRFVNENMAVHGKSYEAGEAAAIIFDKNGAVRAIVGGRDYKKNQFNRAVKSRRQPGSTFKPFVFLAALENGLTPESVVNDSPLQIGDWVPRNYNDRYFGDVTLRKGLARSLNTVSVRLAQWAGRDKVVKTAHRLGINSKIKNHPSLALGTSEVSLFELAGAYVPFANGGFGMQPHVIREIRNSKDETLYKLATPNWGRVIKAHHVAAMNDMMQAAVQLGTGKKAQLGDHPVAGKTGTGQNYRDAWFVGYTSHYVTGVWIGNDDFKPMKRVTGGSLPTMIWRDIMDYAHQNKEVAGLPGGDWRLAKQWRGRKVTSFWDQFSNGVAQPDTRLGTPSVPGRNTDVQRQARHKKSWFEELFWAN